MNNLSVLRESRDALQLEEILLLRALPIQEGIHQ